MWLARGGRWLPKRQGEKLKDTPGVFSKWMLILIGVNLPSAVWVPTETPA